MKYNNIVLYVDNTSFLFFQRSKKNQLDETTTVGSTILGGECKKYVMVEEDTSVEI